MRSDLVVERLEEHVAQRSIEQGGVEAENRDEPARGKGSRGAGQHSAVCPHEMDAIPKCPSVNKLAYARIGGNVLEREQAEAARRHDPLQPCRGRDAQPAVGVVEQRSRSIHGTSLRSPPPGPSATLRS